MKTLVGLLAIALILTGCGPSGQGGAEPTKGPPDLTDFSVAQSIVQESIDVLESSGIGQDSEGMRLLPQALDEEGPTASWCEAVQSGIDALTFARARVQAELLQSTADAQGC